MSTPRVWFLPAALLAVLAGCSGESDTQPAANPNPDAAGASVDGTDAERTPPGGDVVAEPATEQGTETPPAGESAEDTSGEPVHVDAQAGAELLAARSDIVPLDVRTPPEIEKGHLENAVFCDFKADDFETRVGELDRSKPYLVYCAVGGRSSMALATLQKLGFERIYHLDGGMRDWLKAGNKVVQ